MKVDNLFKFGLALWLGWVCIVLGLMGFGVWAVYKLVMHVTGG